MPVTFKTPTSHRITMLDKDAAFMLKAMQTSGNIPGALFTEALPDALKALKDRVEFEKNDEDTDDNNYVGVNTKALPLVELVERAIKKNEKLMWDKG
jgi:hypothetical protein